MFIVHVFIRVKPDCLENFKTATFANVRNSLMESGIMQFDFLARQDDPTRFVLVEVYRTVEDAAKHKETSHYALWRDTVADMMAEPRCGIKYTLLAPPESAQ